MIGGSEHVQRSAAALAADLAFIDIKAGPSNLWVFLERGEVSRHGRGRDLEAGLAWDKPFGRRAGLPAIRRRDISSPCRPLQATTAKAYIRPAQERWPETNRGSLGSRARRQSSWTYSWFCSSKQPRTPWFCLTIEGCTFLSRDVSTEGSNGVSARRRRAHRALGVAVGRPSASRTRRSNVAGGMVPLERFELPTLALRKPCSTPELQRPIARG